MAGRKLVITVASAKNLMPKDGQGSSSAFVQVDFDGQRKTTRIISKDLNPCWNETIEFQVNDPPDMVNEVLEANVFNSSKRAGGRKSKFLGRVSLHGSTFVKKGEEALIYYKLDKRGLFSLVKGELGLIIYYMDGDDERSALNAPTKSKGEKKEVDALNEVVASEVEKKESGTTAKTAGDGGGNGGKSGAKAAKSGGGNGGKSGGPPAPAAARSVENGAAPASPAPPPAEPPPAPAREKPPEAPPNVAAPPPTEKPAPTPDPPLSNRSAAPPPPAAPETPPNTAAPPPAAPKTSTTAAAQPQPAPETPPIAAVPPPAAPEAPPNPQAAPETPPQEAPPPLETPPDLQPKVEIYQSIPKQEDIQCDMKASIGARLGGAPNVVQAAGAAASSATESEYKLRDTRPALGGERSSAYDLVERMHYLFVRVVKARSLAAQDLTGSSDPYVRLVLGNQLTKTRTLPNTLNPEWNQVFAFVSDRHISAGTLEISIWDQNTPTPDAFLGVVFFDLPEIPTRLPPDSPLAPQWYTLEQKRGELGKVSGDIMLAVWFGTQADEAFCDAWQSDTGGHSTSTRSKVYLSPKLWYLRVNVIEAQDLQSPDAPRRLPEVSVKAQLGFQLVRTRVAKRRSLSPFWNEDLMLVASEAMEDSLLIIVEDHQGSDKHEIIGMAQIPLDGVERRVDDRQVASRWFDLQHSWDTTSTTKYQGRVHLRLCFDGGYHVMDETTHLSSDLRPTAKQLWKAPIGVLELGILGAHNLLPMKTKDGRGATDAYCVAKYGPKWVRTRTILDNFSPRWNEQYTWEVYDPCTVLTLCVFDNVELEHENHQHKHARIGKVRVRLSTLEVDRVYTISYPLLVLQPGGLKKVGDIEVAVRFSCVSMFNVIHTYTLPLLPRMHYLYPLSVQQQEVLRSAAMKMVALRLSRSEPPLRPEVVQYVLDSDSCLWSLRRSKANWFRISSILGGFYALSRWMHDIRQWRNPVTTILVHLLFLILLCYPELILPTIFFYMFLIGLWQYRCRSRSPPHIDPRISQAEVVDRDELDEEFDTTPTSQPPDVVRVRYERLRGIAGRIQMVLGDIATQGERVQGLLTWRDPRATSIFVIFCFFSAVGLYVAPFRLAAFLMGAHFLRHPRFRDPLPSTFLNFFRRLPAQSDRIL